MCGRDCLLLVMAVGADTGMNIENPSAVFRVCARTSAKDMHCRFYLFFSSLSIDHASVHQSGPWNDNKTQNALEMTGQAYPATRHQVFTLP